MAVAEEPLYPMSVYIYNPDGTYGAPIRIHSNEELHGDRLKLKLKVAMHDKVEIRITDPGDSLLFHANRGTILFDGEKVFPS